MTNLEHYNNFNIDEFIEELKKLRIGYKKRIPSSKVITGRAEVIKFIELKINRRLTTEEKKTYREGFYEINRYGIVYKGKYR